MILTELTADQLLGLSLVVPGVGFIGILALSFHRNLRELATLVTAGVLFAVVVTLAGQVLAGARPELTVLELAPGLGIFFRVEPLGMLFALIASGLWIVNSIYSIGYMRANNEPRQTIFYLCFAVAIGATIAIAFSGNLVTLFIFYEVLTLSTYPLVTHKGNADAMRAGRIYLGLLMASSMILLLPAILFIYALTGTTDFTAGGILGGRVDNTWIGILLLMFAYGIGKAALIPGHFWLPAAMVAPTPVSALLHAVAVVKAGVFTVLKVVVYVFGIDTLTASGQNQWLIYLAGFTVLAASIIAMRQDNLKKRLAYSTVSQLSYIVLGAALATGAGVIGAAMHIATHAVGKITLFMCAGAIYTAAHKTEISQLSGLGRRMPITFGAFLLASLSIIGLPPLCGMWSKWYLGLGAIEADQLFMLGVLMVSSLLNIAYLLPIPFIGFFGGLKNNVPPDGGETIQATGGPIAEAPIACLIALSVTTLLCLALFVFPGPLFELVNLIPVR